MSWLDGLHRDVREHAQQLLARGWQHDRTSSKHHPRLVWPATGERISLPSTPSDNRWLENSQAQARRIDGHVERHSGPRFRHSRGSGYSPTPSDSERRASERITALRDEIAEIDERLPALCPRRQYDQVRRLAVRRCQLVTELAELHQPAPPLPAS